MKVAIWDRNPTPQTQTEKTTETWFAGELSKNNKFFQALYIFFVIEKSKTVVRPSKWEKHFSESIEN